MKKICKNSKLVILLVITLLFNINLYAQVILVADDTSKSKTKNEVVDSNTKDAKHNNQSKNTKTKQKDAGTKKDNNTKTDANTKKDSKVKNKDNNNSAKKSTKEKLDKKSKKDNKKNKNTQPNILILKDNVEVLRVVDGDTLEVMLDGKQIKIRLVGIQAPELFANPEWAYARESKEALESLFLYSKKVSIEYQSNQQNDKYGRILADVFSDDGLWVNGYLIDKSLAYVYILNNEVPYMEKLLKFESKAILAGNKIWSDKAYQVIKPNRAYQFVNFYKIIEGEILNVKITKNSIWLELESIGEKGFSARISKDDIESLGGLDKIQNYKKKKVRIRGFVEKYSPNFGPLVDIKSTYQIEVLN